MSQTVKLTAEKRTITGRKVKDLRREGIVPANIFGNKRESVAIQLPQAEFTRVFAEAGETSVIDLTVDGKTHPVLVSNIQVHPVTEAILHVDFREVDLTQKVSAVVPVEVTGESPAVAGGLGTLVQQVDEVKVEALPRDLPEKLMVDVSGLTEVDSAVYVKDLSVDTTKITIEADPELIIAKVEPPQKEEEPEPVAEAVEGEAPATEEGETPAEETPAE